MYVCMYVCIYTHTHIYIYVYIYIYIYIQKASHQKAYIYIYIYIYICVLSLVGVFDSAICAESHISQFWVAPFHFDVVLLLLPLLCHLGFQSRVVMARALVCETTSSCPRPPSSI